MWVGFCARLLRKPLLPFAHRCSMSKRKSASWTRATEGADPDAPARRERGNSAPAPRHKLLSNRSVVKEREEAIRKLLLLLTVAVVFTGTSGATDKTPEQTVTGCLGSDDKFTLSTAEGKKYDVTVTKVLNLKPHVGHEVTLTGTPTEGATPVFKASKITHVSDTCKPAAAAPK